MKKPCFIHPFLFTLYPILFLFSHNVYQVSYSDILFPLVISLGFTFLLIILLNAVYKDSKKASIIASILLVLFFSYGHVFALIKDLYEIRHVYMLIAWGMLFSVSVHLAKRTHRDLQNYTNFLNIVALSLCVWSCLNIGIHQFNIRSNWDNFRNSGDRTISATDLGTEDTLRDIYYIILDGYASASTLQDIYGFNNHEFIDYLTEKGFFVASESLSNYTQTFLTLSSSLNLKYINDLTDIVGINSAERTVPYQMIEDNEVMRFLKSKGYMFIHFGSGWGATDRNKYADLEWQCGRGNEFIMIFIQTTLLSPLEEILNDSRGRILCTFSELARIHRIDGPKFIFAHIVSPHPPYLFDANGEPVPEVDFQMSGSVWDQKENYLNQLIFVNKKLKVMVDEILKNSDVFPIIILQADHGSASTFPDSDEYGGWDDPTDIMLKERMRIFNAFFLPSIGEHHLYESVSPVNTFRLIFNYYFNTNYDVLSDKAYYSTYQRPYQFIDVTERVRYP
jgi:hypothetical protein